MKKATFMQRLIAYLLDSIIVLIISSIIASGFSNKKLESLEEELQDTVSTYAKGEITAEEYMKETENLTYEIEKNSTTINLVTIVVTVGYFVIFQYLNKGQSIGKKIMKLKIVDKEEKDPSLIQILLRTFIINQLLQYLIIIGAISIFKQVTFTKIYYTITILTYMFIVVSAIMILYRKDKLGLHDIISKTKVMKEGN